VNSNKRWEIIKTDLWIHREYLFYPSFFGFLILVSMVYQISFFFNNLLLILFQTKWNSLRDVSLSSNLWLKTKKAKDGQPFNHKIVQRIPFHFKIIPAVTKKFFDLISVLVLVLMAAHVSSLVDSLWWWNR